MRSPEFKTILNSNFLFHYADPHHSDDNFPGKRFECYTSQFLIFTHFLTGI
jgi:hypothetical protein